MDSAMDLPQRTREIKVPTNIIRTQEFASLNSNIRQPPLPPQRPPQRLQQRPTNRYAGIWDKQAAHAVSNPNGDLRPPDFTQAQSSQGNKISGGGVGAPSNTANARPSRQLGPRPSAGPRARNRDERFPGNGGLEPPDQGSSVGGAGGRSHHNGNQGAQRSDATQNSSNPLALDPATERLVGKRDALCRDPRVQKGGSTTREAEARPQVAVLDRAQIRQHLFPHPTPSLNLTSDVLYNVRRAETTPRTLAASHAAVVPASDRYLPPEGFGPLLLLGTTARAPHLPRIVDTSGNSFTSYEDVSDDDTDNTRANIEGYTRPGHERIPSHSPAAHQKRPHTKPRPRPTHSPCLICLDVPDEFPHYRPTSSCTHASTICAPCLEQYISHAVRSEGLTTLTCPDPACRQVMEYEDVVRGARKDRACLDRYEGLLRLRRLEREPNFVRCKSPTCNWGQIHERGAAAPIVTCEVCHAQSCFTHDVPWHTGLTCKQYTATRQANRAAEDKASRAYINRHAKKCPNPFCGRWIEKAGGCDHMTCRRCGHEFCWICLAGYGPIHRHTSSCLNYVSRLGRYIPATLVGVQRLPHELHLRLLRRPARRFPS